MHHDMTGSNTNAASAAFAPAGDGDNGSNTDEVSYAKKPEFPFFKERREPWFWLNNTCFFIAFGAFLYFAVTIIQDFIKNRNDPPTATNFVNGLSQSFPGMAFCLHQAVETNITQPDLVPLFAVFDNGLETLDITNQLRQIDCPLAPPSQGCWYLDGNFPAFEYVSPSTCAHRNSMSIGFTFDKSNYSRNVMLVGVDGYLFLSGRSQYLFETICTNNELPLSCSSLVPIDEECNPDRTDLSVDTFFATNQLSNLISLQRSETQTSPRCDSARVQWNPATVVSNYNPKFFEELNVTLTDAESTVLMNLQFNTPDISKTTYNPQSGPSMFGSLSGWFGFLSDGWGIISLLFILEETANYVRALRLHEATTKTIRAVGTVGIETVGKTVNSMSGRKV